jgi:hypothetical protein
MISYTYEIDANSGDVRFGICIVCESQQQAGLSNSRVSDKEKLEKIIVSKDTVVSSLLIYRIRIPQTETPS